jgi:TRAP-type C4-dicarboxylate transport system permease small subunit
MTDQLTEALRAKPEPPKEAPKVPTTPWRRFTALYAQALEILLATCVGILLIPVTLQIISRYTSLIPNYIWTEEMARFLFIWTIMIGAMVGIREATHFEVDLWPQLSRRAEAAVKIIARIGVLAMSLVFVWAGYEFTKFAWNRTSELGDLPLWWIHVAWPIAGVTWIIFTAEQMLDEIRVLLGMESGDPAA